MYLRAAQGQLPTPEFCQRGAWEHAHGRASRLGEVAPAARAAPPPSSVLCARWASPRGSDGVDRSRGGGSRVAGSEPSAHVRPSPTWTVRSPGTCHRPFVPMPSCAPNGDTFHVGKSTRPRLRLWGLDPGGSRDVGPLNPVLFCFFIFLSGFP